MAGNAGGLVLCEDVDGIAKAKLSEQCRMILKVRQKAGMSGSGFLPNFQNIELN
jgi:hypothetical protein